MKIWRKLLRTNNKYSILLFILAAVSFFSCGKNKIPTHYLARVNDSYLTEEQLLAGTDTSNITPDMKKVLVQAWVKNELLFIEAQKANITGDSTYLNLIDKNKKELASSMFCSMLINDKEFTCSEAEISAYYSEHSEEFKSPEESYLCDIIYFKDISAANSFRSEAMQTGWDKTINTFIKHPAVTKIERNSLLSVHQTFSALQSRLLPLMSPEEISLVFEDGNKIFWVLELTSTFRSGEVPPLFAVNHLVSERIIEQKRKAFLDEYISKLYSSNKIEMTIH